MHPECPTIRWGQGCLLAFPKLRFADMLKGSRPETEPKAFMQLMEESFCSGNYYVKSGWKKRI